MYKDFIFMPMVLNEIVPKALNLMTDVFGTCNYVVQKVILFLTFELYNVLLLCLNGYQIHYIRKEKKNFHLFYACLTYSESCSVF